MKIQIRHKIVYSCICISLIVLFFSASFLFAGTLPSWKDSRAYRPAPVLFLHGFGLGSPQAWVEADARLKQFFSKYYTGYSSDPTILASTRSPYLEIIDFGSSLIDRNSSIDTYKAGDRYVGTGQRRAGDPGWSDKLNVAVETLRQYYRDKDGSPQKIIFVTHSMAGLAGRKYLKSYSYANQKIDKLIMIGTPNCGSMLAASLNISYTRNRRWGWYSPPRMWVSSVPVRDTSDTILESFLRIDIHGDAVWDMDPTSTGSGFMIDLNYHYPSTVDHFVIAGKHWLSFNKGDDIVSLDSQLGRGVLLLKDYIIISATHGSEPVISVRGENPLLQFLDYARPELEIVSPDPHGTIESYVTSIIIQGRVYKEYLPADSRLIIDIERKEDAYKFPIQESYLKPSDLWMPNNPDSPIAEFDETISFPGPGTYRIALKVMNPVGRISEVKEIIVKILSQKGASVIVHCHNPEGKEIASIEGMSAASVTIYDGSTCIGSGADRAEAHNNPIPVTAGKHIIKAKFNGMVEEGNITLGANETQTVIFTFRRTEYDLIKAIESASTTMRDSFEPRDDGTTTERIVYASTGQFIWDACRKNAAGSLFSATVSVKISGDMINISGFGTRPEVNSGVGISQVRIRQDIGGEYIYAYKQIDFSSSDTFDNWIIQTIYPNLQTNAAIDMSLEKPNPSYIHHNLTPWSLNGFSPERIGTCLVLYIDKEKYYITATIYGQLQNFLYDNNYYHMWDIYYNYVNSNPLNATIGLSNIKMSSVPYDITDTGV